MIKQETSNLLDNILTQKDLELFNTYELEIKQIEKQIAYQKSKKDELVQHMNLLSEKVESNKHSKLDEILLLQANSIFNDVNENIKTLYSWQSDLVNLDETVVDFLMKFKSDHITSIPEQDIIKMKDHISNAYQKYRLVQSKVSLNDTKINHFLDQVSTGSQTDSTKKQKPSYKTFSLPDSEGIKDNLTLIISEKTRTIFLPYTRLELEEYYRQYPKDYKSYQDIIKKEFILPLDTFKRHSTIARFREGYSLIRDKEMKSFFEALKFGLDLMFRGDLNPAIIPACKSEDVLNEYLECLEQKKLEKFKAFEIRFEVNPLKK